jgi:2-keto-3-deoxy-L-rhamnonate aldolase RhmA
MGLIEDASVVETIDAVLDQAKVDCLMPGPADLATSLGLHGQLRHPTVLAAIEKIKTSALRRNIPLGLYINDPVEVQTQDPTSIGFYVYSIDYKALAKHLNEVALEARKIYRAATQ